MTELPVAGVRRVRGYGAAGVDGVRWRVLLSEGADDHTLVVDLPEAERAASGLTVAQLDERLPAALQRFAEGRLDASGGVLGQVEGWPQPLVLEASHFA